MPPRQKPKPCWLNNCPHLPNGGPPEEVVRFADRVQNLIDEEHIVREGLWHEGPRLVEAVIRRCGSLRAAARMAGLSPTYLCGIRHSRVIVSASAFVCLARLVDADHEPQDSASRR